MGRYVKGLHRKLKVFVKTAEGVIDKQSIDWYFEKLPKLIWRSFGEPWRQAMLFVDRRSLKIR